ncbi:MAG: serine protease [Bacteroidetes bacterium]|nr:serine protease [Bacteroidota bacterium]
MVKHRLNIPKFSAAIIFLAITLSATAQIQQTSGADSSTKNKAEHINLDSIGKVIDSLNSLLLFQVRRHISDSASMINAAKDLPADDINSSRVDETEGIRSMINDEKNKKKWTEELNKNKSLYYGVNTITGIYSFKTTILPSEVLKSARCVCAIINKSYLTETDTGYTIKASKLCYKFVTAGSVSLQLCRSEKFIEEICASTGTGWAYKDNLIVTATHCFKKNNETDYSNYLFIFDFLEIDSGAIISKTRVFRPVGKVTLKPEDKNLEFTIIQVDRPVPEFRYAELDNVPPSSINPITTRLFMLGHPLGLPLKYAPDGKISYSADNYFITNLNAYAGNSGSPVFRSGTKKVVGMLVCGNNDFEQGATGCAVSTHHPEDYPENHFGEKVERIINALKKY